MGIPARAESRIRARPSHLLSTAAPRRSTLGTSTAVAQEGMRTRPLFNWVILHLYPRNSPSQLTRHIPASPPDPNTANLHRPGDERLQRRAPRGRWLSTAWAGRPSQALTSSRGPGSAPRTRLTLSLCCRCLSTGKQPATLPM